MYTYVKVGEGRLAHVKLSSGFGPGPHVRLVGSTFPIIPNGTVVDQLRVQVPEDLQAAAFFCRVDEPRRMGSGKTAYLDRTPLLSMSVLLSWDEGDKLVLKADSEMSPAELARFNPFVRTKDDILVTDSEYMVVYGPGLASQKMTDPDWTYKVVPVSDLLRYITKQVRLEWLDASATEVQSVQDRIAELEATLADERGHCERLYNENVGLDFDLRFERQRNAILSNTLDQVRQVANSSWLEYIRAEGEKEFLAFLTRLSFIRHITAGVDEEKKSS